MSHAVIHNATNARRKSLLGWTRSAARGLNARAGVSTGVLAVLAWLAVMVPVATAGEQRIALVVGNAAYRVGPLANPRRDGELMARTLEALGFSVLQVSDADRTGLSRAVLEFGRRLRASKDAVALFYYAGHGVQRDGQNYLLPVDADITSESEVALASLNLSEVLLTMGGARARISIAILDACRNNPFLSATRGLSRGLASVSAPSGMLIAYATAPGEVALDGEDGHSPYTRALTRALALPGLAIEDVFKRTREEVLRQTASAQVPWEHSSLVGHFVMRAKSAGPEVSGRDDVPGASAQRLAELAAWERISASNDPADYRRHLEAFPGGDFAELASFRVERLTRQDGAWSWFLTGALERSAGEVAGAHYERAVKLEAAGSTGDLAEARRLYGLAADAGLMAASYRLGRMLDRGAGGNRDIAAAAVRYREASDQGHAAAMAALATMHEFGEGVAPNLVEALRLYRLAADAGDADGLAGLAYLFAQGKGVAADRTEARRLYAAAAALGQPRAMHNLALMLLAAEGGVRDAAGGLRWLEQAAARGHGASLRELAAVLDEGRAGRRDPPRAAALLIEAIAAGDRTVLEDITARPWSWTYWTRRAVQKALTERGVYQGRINGVMAGATRAALERLAPQASAR